MGSTNDDANDPICKENAQMAGVRPGESFWVALRMREGTSRTYSTAREGGVRENKENPCMRTQRICAMRIAYFRFTPTTSRGIVWGECKQRNAKRSERNGLKEN